jgi:hypothetical protein
VKFKPLLDRWRKDPPPLRTAREYAIRLPIEDAARLHALLDLFPGRTVEEIVTDLLHAGLDEIEAAMPYEPGPRVISQDEQGDPIYEDVGLTPRFVELSRNIKKELETEPAAASDANPRAAPGRRQARLVGTRGARPGRANRRRAQT